MIRDDREDRAEDLLLHDGALPGRIRDQSRGEEAVFGIIFPDANRFQRNERTDPFVVVVIHDAGEVFAGIVGVGIFERGFRGRHERFVSMTGHEHKIRGDAGLARVEEFGGDDSLHCGFDGSVIGDDNGTFPPQLQGDRGEAARCGFTIETTDPLTSGIEPVVERVFEKLFAQLTPPSTTATCWGLNAALIISARIVDEAGASSDGFRTTVFPAATAATRGLSESWTG